MEIPNIRSFITSIPTNIHVTGAAACSAVAIYCVGRSYLPDLTSKMGAICVLSGAAGAFAHFVDKLTVQKSGMVALGVLVVSGAVEGWMTGSAGTPPAKGPTPPDTRALLQGTGQQQPQNIESPRAESPDTRAITGSATPQSPGGISPLLDNPAEVANFMKFQNHQQLNDGLAEILIALTPLPKDSMISVVHEKECFKFETKKSNNRQPTNHLHLLLDYLQNVPIQQEFKDTLKNVIEALELTPWYTHRKNKSNPKALAEAHRKSPQDRLNELKMRHQIDL